MNNLETFFHFANDGKKPVCFDFFDFDPSLIILVYVFL